MVSHPLPGRRCCVITPYMCPKRSRVWSKDAHNQVHKGKAFRLLCKTREAEQTEKKEAFVVGQGDLPNDGQVESRHFWLTV